MPVTRTPGLTRSTGTGPISLPPESYKEYLNEGNTIFLFTTNTQPYPGEEIQNIHCISKQALINWMKEHSSVISPTMKLNLSLSLPLTLQ